MCAYYRIDDILAEETVATVVLRTSITNMGFLEPGNPHPDLAHGTKLRLHLWLAQVLQREAYADMELPYQYGRAWASTMGAGAKTTELGAMPYWYEVGIKVATALPEHSERVTRMLTAAFGERYVDIFTYAQNWRDEQGAHANRRYCAAERRLYDGEYAASTQFEEWKNHPVTKIVASELSELDRPLVVGGSTAEPESKRFKPE